MKRLICPKSRSELLQQFPIEDYLEGWFFRIEEVSADVYLVEGSDLFGRTVSNKGTEPDNLLRQCVTDAELIKRELEKTS